MRHDIFGRNVSTTHPDASSAATYVRSGGLYSVTTHEDPTGLNLQSTTWTRDTAGRTGSVVTRTAGNAIRSAVGHTYDGASRRKSATYEDTLGQAYGYDAASQVTSARVGISNAASANPAVSSTHSYAYDDAGNRTSSLAFGQSTSYTANDVNAYTAISGGGFQAPSPTYDLNGNTLTLPRNNGSTLGLTWDSTDRLRTVSSPISNPTSTTSSVYDPLGRLVWVRTTTQGGTGGSPVKDEIWSWSGWTLLARELFTASTLDETFRYTWGPDLSGTLEGAGGVGGLLAIERAVGNSTTWDIRHVHHDANGNVLCLTDTNGAASARYRYSPFGETISTQDLDNSGWATKNIHRFSTKPEVAGTSLLYYGYRHYDPQTGRWPSRDPIEEQGGLNVYGFTYNNFINYIDYLGLVPKNPALRKKCDEIQQRKNNAKNAYDKAKKSYDKSKKSGEDGCDSLDDMISALNDEIAARNDWKTSNCDSDDCGWNDGKTEKDRRDGHEKQLEQKKMR